MPKTEIKVIATLGDHRIEKHTYGSCVVLQSTYRLVCDKKVIKKSKNLAELYFLMKELEAYE